MSDNNHAANNGAVASEVIGRVKKLLSLASHGSATEAEAAVAMRLADQLIFAYSISQVQLNAYKDVGNDPFIKHTFDIGYIPKPYTTWAFDMMCSISYHNFCSAFWWPPRVMRESLKKNGATGVKPFPIFGMVGKSANTQMVEYLFRYLYKTFMNMADVTWEDEKHSVEMFKRTMGFRPAGKAQLAIKWKLSFMVGCYHRIQIRMRDERAESIANVDNSMALVPMMHAAADEAKYTFFPNLRDKVSDVKSAESTEAGAYQQGLEAAKTISLHRPIEESNLAALPAGK